MGLFIQYSFKWYPYWYILMYILMYIPLVHSFWLIYSLLFKYTPGYYPLICWWTFSWFSLSCNSKQSCWERSSRHFTVHIQRSLSATYLGVELLDMFIFNLNWSCRIAASLTAVMWNCVVGFRSIVVSFFPSVSYAFEALQFLQFIPFSRLESHFLSLIMENCNSYYESLHLDRSYLS